jgi:hypothetical protein
MLDYSSGLAKLTNLDFSSTIFNNSLISGNLKIINDLVNVNALYNISKFIPSYSRIIDDISLPLLSLASSTISIKTEGTYANRLMEEYEFEKSISGNDETQLSENVIELEKKTEEKIISKKDWKSTAFDILNLTLAIAIWIRTEISSRQMEERLIRNILQSEQRIITTFENTVGKLSVHDRKFIVIRDTELKSKPRSNSVFLGTIESFTLVDIINETDKWAYITFFNPVTGESDYGWIRKKYLGNGNNLKNIQFRLNR